MKNLIQYSFSCTNAMFNYLKDGNLGQLISDLNRVQDHAIENIGGEGASLWFKFGADDTLATTIGDIARDLQLPSSHGNHKLMIENFDLVVNNMDANKELRVFYS